MKVFFESTHYGKWFVQGDIDLNLQERTAVMTYRGVYRKGAVALWSMEPKDSVIEAGTEIELVNQEVSAFPVLIKVQSFDPASEQINATYSMEGPYDKGLIFSVQPDVVPSSVCQIQ